MSLYVYIVNSDLAKGNGKKNHYILSYSLTLYEAQTYLLYTARKEKSNGGLENRIIELAIPEDKFEEFRRKLDIYCSAKDIEAFIKLNDKYKQDGLKFMPPAPAEEGKKEESKSSLQASASLGSVS